MICGVLIGLASPAAVYLAGGAATLAAAALTSALGGAPTSASTGQPLSEGKGTTLPNPPSAVPDGSDLGGLATLRADPGRLLAVVLLATRFGVAAAMDVLLVLAAIEVLGMGAAGAGYLSAAIGLGGIVGGATTLVIVGRPRLTPLTLAGRSSGQCRSSPSPSWRVPKRRCCSWSGRAWVSPWSTSPCVPCSSALSPTN